MNNKGFVTIIVIVLVVVLAGAAWYFFYFKKQQISIQESTTPPLHPSLPPPNSNQKINSVEQTSCKYGKFGSKYKQSVGYNSLSEDDKKIFDADARRSSSLYVLKLGLTLYKDERSQYPQSLNDLVPKYISPNEPAINNPEYQYKKDGNEYSLSVSLDMGQCLYFSTDVNPDDSILEFKP